MEQSDTSGPRDAATDSPRSVRHHVPLTAGTRWEDVDVLEYKESGSHFSRISRQVLFGTETGLESELRYFEIQPGGYSTLERHDHVHAVMILTGRGRVLVGRSIHDVNPFDLIHIPPGTWHQFHADSDAILGFLCLVACDRDRPQRPAPEDVETLREDSEVASFIRL